MLELTNDYEKEDTSVFGERTHYVEGCLVNEKKIRELEAQIAAQDVRIAALEASLAKVLKV